MKPVAGNSSSRSMGVIFRDWVLVIPLFVACVAVAGFLFLYELVERLPASIYRVEYFLPLPFYCVAVFIWTFVSMAIVGFVVSGSAYFKNMPSPEFKPGFRFSAFDACVLVAGGLGALIAWPRIGWIGFAIAFVTCHFFLFCNVFRISRALELIWAAVFIVLTALTAIANQLTWTATISLSLATTIVLVVMECRKPSYHGVGWSRINPKLREWWHARQQSENRD